MYFFSLGLSSETRKKELKEEHPKEYFSFFLNFSPIYYLTVQLIVTYSINLKNDE